MMKSKRAKRIAGALILASILIALAFGLSEIIDLLKTPVLEMTVFHAVLLVALARVIFWERKVRW